MRYAEEAARIAAAVIGLPVKVRKYEPDPQNPARRRFAGWEAASVAGPADDANSLAWGIAYDGGRTDSVRWADVMFPNAEVFEEAISRLSSATT
ncbi:hypothetical protein [Streptomyces sp. NPDC002172]